LIIPALIEGLERVKLLFFRQDDSATDLKITELR